LHAFFATASAGTEDLLAAELRALGLRDIRPGRGGVRFKGELVDGLKVCLWSRTAMRVLLSLSNFPATDADALYAGARAIPWNDLVTPTHTIAVDATGMTDQLRHTHFTALKVKDAICDVVRDKTGARPSVDARDPDVRVVVHLGRGKAEISLDLAGDALFKRGYRLEPTKASLKETLAAAVLLAAGYDGNAPLIDPMCGSGTIALEAALIAYGRAPGIARRFAAERWPSFGAESRKLLADLRNDAKARERKDAPAIIARDRDPEAVQATGMNAKRLGLPIHVKEADARELNALNPPGWIVTNPPYGERLAPGKKNLKTFFWQLGSAWSQLEGHRVAVLSGGPEFEKAFGMRPLEKRRLWNGPIECELLRFEMRGKTRRQRGLDDRPNSPETDAESGFPESE